MPVGCGRHLCPFWPRREPGPASRRAARWRCGLPSRDLGRISCAWACWGRRLGSLWWPGLARCWRPRRRQRSCRARGSPPSGLASTRSGTSWSGSAPCRQRWTRGPQVSPHEVEALETRRAQISATRRERAARGAEMSAGSTIWCRAFWRAARWCANAASRSGRLLADLVRAAVVGWSSIRPCGRGCWRSAPVMLQRLQDAETAGGDRAAAGPGAGGATAGDRAAGARCSRSKPGAWNGSASSGARERQATLARVEAVRRPRWPALTPGAARG